VLGQAVALGYLVLIAAGEEVDGPFLRLSRLRHRGTEDTKKKTEKGKDRPISLLLFILLLFSVLSVPLW
jgi:hypothetical protein